MKTMSHLGWVVFQFFIIFLKYRNRNSLSLLLCGFLIIFLPTAVVGDRSAFVDVYKNGENIGENHGMEDQLKLVGSFSSAGATKTAQGQLHSLSDGCGNNDDSDLERRPVSEEWVAVLDYTHPTHGASQQTGTNNPDDQCQSVLDRVKKAMLFGASAIIILALNPKIVKELDITQLFSRPVVLIQEMENVTTILGAIASKLKMHVKLTYNTSFYDLQKISTLTLWATCGRSNGVDSYNEWEGVVCLGKEDDSKADPGNFWNYFFTSLSLIFLLLVMKAKRGSGNDEFGPDQIELAMQEIACHVLRAMKCRRYHANCRRDEDQENCAVCLDTFHENQRIRELPCGHQFHAKCVDRWIIQQRTCPLCKRNILDNQPLPLCF